MGILDMLNLVVFCMSDGILSMVGAVYCSAPDLLYIKGSLLMCMSEPICLPLIGKDSNYSLMDSWIKCRNNSRIKSMFVLCCAKSFTSSVWFKWCGNSSQSLVLVGAAHSLGLILPCLGDTGNIYEYLSHRNMESTSRLFWWSDQKCLFVFI